MSDLPFGIDISKWQGQINFAKLAKATQVYLWITGYFS